jgi:uncharacterized protein (TIGR00730 family)
MGHNIDDTNAPGNTVATSGAQANMLNGSYRIAFDDKEFLYRDELRGARLMLEYEKPEAALRAMQIQSTIVAFGSARVPSPEEAEAMLRAASTPEEKKRAQMRAGQVRWYEMAREFGRIASREGGALNGHIGEPLHNVIATGGGPGLMEAANRGAHDVGAPSIGFNITIEHEQRPNPYSSPELTFLFKYFGIRKMHLALRARALAVFPGGFGTFDELFEVLNLQTCGKMPMIPVVLFDRQYWSTVCNMQALVDTGMISPEALDLIAYADSAEEGWEIVQPATLDPLNPALAPK